jgi:hypothetical protein
VWYCHANVSMKRDIAICCGHNGNDGRHHHCTVWVCNISNASWFMLIKLFCWQKHTFLVWSASASFKLMIISCAKQIHNCITCNRYCLCVAVVQWLWKHKEQLLARNLSKKHIVNHYEEGGKIVVFVSRVILKICLD